MKRFMFVMVMLALFAAMPGFVFGGYGNSGTHSNNATAAFEKLKSLSGTWDTTSPEGEPATVTYQVVSNGSAVMETISHKSEANMITMYTVDGDHLMMTHYCGIGNQPRMRASVPSGDITELKFNFVDGANMKKTDMHMHALDMKFIDDTHVQETWSLYNKGKLQNDHAFSLTKKS
jgi:hypothetical protein